MRYSAIIIGSGDLPLNLQMPMTAYHFSTKEKLLECVAYIANMLGNEYETKQEENHVTFTKKKGEGQLLIVFKPIQWDILLTELKIGEINP